MFMKRMVRFTKKNLLLPAISLLVCAASANHASAQCSTGAAPVYSSSCSRDYYEDISASGAGVSSTISISGITACSSTYNDDYATQGITAPGGSVVTMGIARHNGYAAYLTVYVDWNNDGMYATSELAGILHNLTDSTTDTTYAFTIPTSGVVTGTHLHMRLMLSEEATGAPCTATYGQTYDFFLVVGTGCTTPVITFTPSSHDSICAGGAGQAITASGAGIGGTFTWSPSTGLSASTGSTVTANPTASTVYTVTGTTTSSCSATYYDTVTIVSGIMGSDTINSVGTDKFCTGDSVLLHGIPGSGYNYQWYNGSTIITHATSEDYEALASGSYTLKISAYGCSVTSPAVVVTVYPLPLPVITATGKLLQVSGSYASYQWYEGGTAITGATHDTVSAYSTGAYTVKVTDTSGCQATSAAHSYSNLGVANTINSAGIEIYPNPASSIIHIAATQAVNAVITSIEGKKITAQNNVHDMDISTLPAGMYFIELYDETGHRLMVQRLIKN